MDTRIPLYRPEGFKDSDKWALGPKGELIEWKWDSLHPRNFTVDEKGIRFHHCPDERSWSGVVRHGEEATNFFEEDENPLPSKAEQVESSAGGNNNNNSGRYISSYKGKFQVRKRKYKKRKYKNSPRRRSNAPDKKQRRRKKAFKRERTSVEKHQMPVSRAACQYCLTEGNVENIYLDPREKYSCDFCTKCFNGLQLKGHVCENCLDRCYRCKFCDECKENLGEWEVDWRMRLNIPRYLHPKRCNCQECFQFRWLRPCYDCGMTSHTAQYCPWRDHIPQDYEDYCLEVMTHYLAHPAPLYR